MRVKICGICSAEDARAAERLGASYLGMILSQGFKRSLLPDQAVDIAVAVEIPVVAVLVDESVAEAARLAAIVGASVIQLHGEESPEAFQELKSLGDWTIWKAVRVRRPTDVTQALIDYAGVGGLLLDAWHAELPGGAGVAFQWEDFSSSGDVFPPEIDMIAAGGLSPDNVERAVRVLSPDVVDVSSGVELAPRIKDHEKVRAFIENARKTEGLLHDTGQQ